MFPDSMVEKIVFGLGLLATVAAMATRAHADAPVHMVRPLPVISQAAQGAGDPDQISRAQENARLC